MDPANISYEQLVAAAKLYGATILSAGEQMKRNKQIEVFNRVHGALRMIVTAMDGGKQYSPEDLRRALAALDEYESPDPSDEKKYRNVSYTIVLHETKWNTWLSWAEIPDQPTGKRIAHKTDPFTGYLEEVLHEEEAIASAKAAAHRAIDEYFK